MHCLFFNGSIGYNYTRFYTTSAPSLPLKTNASIVEDYSNSSIDGKVHIFAQEDSDFIDLSTSPTYNANLTLLSDNSYNLQNGSLEGNPTLNWIGAASASEYKFSENDTPFPINGPLFVVVNIFNVTNDQVGNAIGLTPLPLGYVNSKPYGADPPRYSNIEENIRFIMIRGMLMEVILRYWLG